MYTRRKNRRVLWMIALTLLLGSCATSTGVPFDSPAQPLDPQSLIGEWIGRWTLISNRYEGRYYLTIDKVDDNRVYGQLEATSGNLPSSLAPPRNFAIIGVLEGNHLTYGSTTLEIDGSEMRGRDHRYGPSYISLRKSTQPLRVPFAAPAGGPGANGVYAGQVCYGPRFSDPSLCYRAQAILSNGKFSGQWPARAPGETMVLVGEVSASGETMIRMHIENAERDWLTTIDLSGTLRDGRLDATGSFLPNGRTVTIIWKKK